MGKKFTESMRKAGEERAASEADFRSRVSDERYEQYLLFRKWFAVIFISFVAIITMGLFLGMARHALFLCLAVAVAGTALYFRPPRRVRYRSVFLMAPIAFGAGLLFAMLSGPTVADMRGGVPSGGGAYAETYDDDYERFLVETLGEEFLYSDGAGKAPAEDGSQ